METTRRQDRINGYKTIADELCGQIIGGQLALGAQLPPIREGAKQYGVTYTTFSRVIRELQQAGYVRTCGRHGTFVSDAWTRTPAANGQNDSVSRTRPLRVGMVATWRSDNPAGTSWVHLVLERLLTATVFQAGGTMQRFLWTDASSADRLVGEIVDTPLDGLVLPSAPIRGVPGLPSRLRDAGVFCVGFAGTQAWSYDFDCVKIDDEWAFREVTRRLIAMGHRRIAFVGLWLEEPNMASWTGVRLAAWRGALAEAGLACGEADVFLSKAAKDDPNLAAVPTGGWPKGIELVAQETYGCAAALRFDPSRHTAAVCVNDGTAQGLIKGLRARGLRVPEDVSVTGYDNNPDDNNRRELTTFALPEQKIVDAFLRVISGRVSGEKPADVRTTENLRPILVSRSSWAPIPEVRSQKSEDGDKQERGGGMSNTSTSGKTRILATVLGLAFVLGAALPATAATLYVAPAPFGSDSTGTGSSAAPYASITNAVAQAGINTICVGAGVYTQKVTIAASQTNTIQGGYNTNDWSWSPSNQITVIQSTGGVSVVTIASAGTNTLRALTLRGGTNTSQAGIVVTAAAAPILLVDSCTITGNYYGVCCSSYRVSVNLTLRNCLIARNRSSGIYSYYPNGGACNMNNCTIANNGSDGYTTLRDQSATLVPYATNCLFTGNNGYGINQLGDNFAYACYSLFYGNTNGAWYGYADNSQGGFTSLGHNKVNRDPLYVSAATGNYQLQDNSPAAAAGTSLAAAGVTNDIVNAVRPGVNGWDMGAYQGNETAAAALTNVAYVSKSGSDSTGDGSQGNPWATISYGLGGLTNVATATGTLYVAAGTYTENVSLGDGAITLCGGYNPSGWAWDPANQKTVIQSPQPQGKSAVTMFSAVGPKTLNFVTLCGATNTGSAGVDEEAYPTPSLTLNSCTSTGNYCGVSAPYACAAEVMTLRNCLIARNTSAGVYTYSAKGGQCYMFNCTIADNGSHGYSGIQLSDTCTIPIATNCVFSGNNGYGIYQMGNTGTYVDYSLFNGNTNGPWYSRWNNAGFLLDGLHNKFARDPLYVSAATGNYQLQNSSPAAAAGATLTAAGVTNDLVNVARPGANGWDMGAYQGNETVAAAALATGYVSKLGSDIPANGAQGSPWATISYGLGGITTNGTLYVASGVYTENVVLASGAQTISGGYTTNWVWSPASQGTVVIQGAGGNSAVSLISVAGAKTLNFLTMRGGTNLNKAAVEVVDGPSSRLTLNSCTITGNYFGVYAWDGSAPTLTLRNCLIARSKSSGIYGYNPSAGLCYMYNCTFATNGANGFSVGKNNVDGIIPVATNCMFTGNVGYGINMIGQNGAWVNYSYFYGNTSGAWFDQKPNLVDGGNNITNLLQPPGYVSEANGNYQLTTASPAYNTGTNLTASGVTMDILGVSRPQGKIFDRGAYELVPSPAGSAVFFR